MKELFQFPVTSAALSRERMVSLGMWVPLPPAGSETFTSWYDFSGRGVVQNNMAPVWVFHAWHVVVRFSSHAVHRPVLPACPVLLNHPALAAFPVVVSPVIPHLQQPFLCDIGPDDGFFVRTGVGSFTAAFASPPSSFSPQFVRVCKHSASLSIRDVSPAVRDGATKVTGWILSHDLGAPTRSGLVLCGATIGIVHLSTVDVWVVHPVRVGGNAQVHHCLEVHIVVLQTGHTFSKTGIKCMWYHKTSMYTSPQAYDMRDYQNEDFQKPTRQRYPTVGEELSRDRKTMGLGTEIGKPGKYAEFYRKVPVTAKEDYERGLVMATVPRYSGPKNTRCDIYELENGRFQISGKVNHAQASCVYLKQDFSVTLQADNGIFQVPRFKNLRPFSIQKQFTRMLWSSPQTSSSFNTNIEQNVKLAPYLASAHDIERQCRYKCQVRKITAENRRTFNFTMFEPLLGFQSGWSMLKAIRPFDQQNSGFPLAIQDYTLSVDRVTDRKSIVKRIFRDKSKAVLDDLHDGLELLNTEATFAAVPGSTHPNVQFPSGDEQDYSLSNIKLVTYTDDSATQENKSTSTISLHAPVFMNFTTSIELPHVRGAPPNAIMAYDDFTDATTTNFVTRPLILGGKDTASADAPELKLRISSSKGLPSYILLYLESEGCDYYDPTLTHSPDNHAFGTDNLIGAHPKIHSLRISLFGQEFPITRQLESVEELEYLTRKNCHRECDFATNMRYDPIVFLSLEDLGLATEQVGYPNSKRLEMEIDVRQIVLPKFFWRELALNDSYKVKLVCSLVYENHCLQGTTNRADFYWK